MKNKNSTRASTKDIEEDKEDFHRKAFNNELNISSSLYQISMAEDNDLSISHIDPASPMLRSHSNIRRK